MVHPFEIVAHPVRRRIVEILAVGAHTAGTLCEVARADFGSSRTAVSHQLRTLREHGVVWSTVDPDEPRSRSYRLNPAFLASLDGAVAELFDLWEQRDGTAERRPPLPPVASPPPEGRRMHRLGEAERRRRREMPAEWAPEEWADEAWGDEVDGEP